MTTIREIFQRVREKLAQNQDMPGNNCLVYFDNLNIRGDIYDGNSMVAQVGNVRGPWKAAIYLRLKMEFTAPALEDALNELERIVTVWAGSNTVVVQQEDDGYLGTVDWKGWKVDLYQDDKDE